ncbi:thrombomodulin-like [Phyllobates terribilis]|uniref:thrombomodulin-like n=1 Tax=Phyllobates terribilis TaxID=111132 RepID=UPI003CCA893C
MSRVAPALPSRHFLPYSPLEPIKLGTNVFHRNPTSGAAHGPVLSAPMLLLCFTWSALILAQLTHVAPQEEPGAEFHCTDRTCYAISWISKRFVKARGACKEKNGDLMTVKNSVQAGAIAKFMARAHREDTSVWIGLEHRTKCTDLQQDLRGFTWVTGDNDTDYTNWRNDEQKCGAFCVTVRKNGTWEETNCDSKADGFLCEISYSSLCSSVVLLSFHSVTYSHFTLGMPHSEGTEWPPGTRWPPGTKVDISTDPAITTLSCEEKDDETVVWSSETPGAWNCLIENGGCEHECKEEFGIAECKCPSGSELKSDQRGCTKPCDPSPCDKQPVPDPEGSHHKCPGGYMPAADGKTCEDIDECADIPNRCELEKHKICKNTVGGFSCDCKPGFEMGTAICDSEDNCVTHCHIIDECDNHMCEHTCESYPGGHRCVCNEGFTIDETNRNKCNWLCNTSSCRADCSKNNGCMCPQGYILEQTDKAVKVCNVINLDTPPPISTCPEGYIMDNGECIQPTRAPSEIIVDTPAPTSRPADIYSLQPIIMWGFCSGLLSMLIVLIVMLSHRMRKHYIYQHDLDYNYKNADKDVVLKKIIMEPQWRL